MMVMIRWSLPGLGSSSVMSQPDWDRMPCILEPPGPRMASEYCHIIEHLSKDHLMTSYLDGDSHLLGLPSCWMA